MNRFRVSRWSLIITCIGSLLCSHILAAAPSNVQAFQALEAQSGGRLGVVVIDGSKTNVSYRANERFPMGCTSKVMGVAAILHQSMSDPTLLQQRLHYQPADIVAWSPITKQHLHDGMTVRQLCEAAIRYSDNTAMNLLVSKLGGLEAINQFARSLGDQQFRQDHAWPEEALSGGAGNVQDSTTPRAMAMSLHKLLLGNVLAHKQKALLLDWMKTNTTGHARLRAGVPKSWSVADKTGTGIHYGTTNDVGILWPPNHGPIIIAAYYTSNNKQAHKRDDIIANVAKRFSLHFSTVIPGPDRESKKI